MSFAYITHNIQKRKAPPSGDFPMTTDSDAESLIEVLHTLFSRVSY
jgi:hypothetical protein